MARTIDSSGGMLALEIMISLIVNTSPLQILRDDRTNWKNRKYWVEMSVVCAILS